jgi:hypothetical protein
LISEYSLNISEVIDSIKQKLRLVKGIEKIWGKSVGQKVEISLRDFATRRPLGYREMGSTVGRYGAVSGYDYK